MSELQVNVCLQNLIGQFDHFCHASSLPMTRECDFLLAVVRRFFHPESALPPEDGLDWNLVAGLAEQHAVTGFLQRERSVAPRRADASATARDNLALSAELAKLAGVFESQRIDVMPLKGPVLGAALYKHEVLKSSTDLDLLVRRRDVLRAKLVLESIGYRLMTVPHWPSDRAYLRNINDELAFRDPKLWLKLDLHWNLLPGYFPAPLSEVDVWAQARPGTWGAAQLKTLSPEHQLMFLCAHGAKHLWARLGWLCDLGMLVRVESGMNWNEVLTQARLSHTTRMTLLGLALVETLLGVELPSSVAGLIAADASVRELAAEVSERFRRGLPATHTASAVFCARVLELPSQQLRLLLGMFVQPTEAEYRNLQMPPALYWAYYPFRPLRLAAKHAARLRNAKDRPALDASHV